MKHKMRNILMVIVLVVLGIVVFKFNVYNTQFFSVFFGSGTIHTPMELEKVSYVSFLSQEVEGAYTFTEEKDLAMWDDFVAWMNDTTMTKVRGTEGRSYSGEGIYLKFKGIEDEFWIVVGENGKSLCFGDYVWKADKDIVLPVDEAFLLEKKKEQIEE